MAQGLIQYKFQLVGLYVIVSDNSSGGVLYIVPANTVVLTKLSSTYFQFNVMGENVVMTIYWLDVVLPDSSSYANIDLFLDGLASVLNVPITGGGGGGGPYAGASPTTVTVGGLNAGSAITGLSYDALFQSILVPYIAPTFSAFQINGQTSALEVGDTVASGSRNFTWSTTTPANINSNSILIRDLTTSTTLASGLANSGSSNATILAVTNSSPATHTWQIQGTNTQSTTFTRNYSVTWQYRVYYGTNLIDPTSGLASSDITAMTPQLSSGFAGTYSFSAGGYKWICYPSSFGTATNFKDTSNNFNVAMSPAVLVSVTNGFSLVTQYRCHRTLNVLGSSINIQVS